MLCNTNQLIGNVGNILGSMNASANLFQMLHALSVYEFSSLFSDFHNPVLLSIKLDFTKGVYVENFSEHEETKLWNAEISDILSIILMPEILRICQIDWRG